MDPKEVGTVGGDAEKNAIADGRIAYGKGKATVAVVQPLRVNLPLSGTRYAFSQVLQLKTGEALTVIV